MFSISEGGLLTSESFLPKRVVRAVVKTEEVEKHGKLERNIPLLLTWQQEADLLWLQC